MPSQEERRVFQLGGSLAVTLPKPWADYHRLQAGDRVIVITGDDLRIRLQPKRSTWSLGGTTNAQGNS
jgi:antitoxin component of MazEF toxin-antitoxin module